MDYALLIAFGLGLALEATATGIFLKGQLSETKEGEPVMQVHPVTLFGLSAVMTVGTWSSFSSGANWGAYVLALMTASTWLVFLISLWHLVRKPNRVYQPRKVDWYLAAAGLVLLVLRAVWLPPLESSIASIVCDTFFLWPTLREYWDDPESAGWHGKWNWTLTTAATLLAVFTLETYTLSSVLYPIYIVPSTAWLAAACWGWTPGKNQYKRFEAWRKTHIKTWVPRA